MTATRLLPALALASASHTALALDNDTPLPNATGAASTHSALGVIEAGNPFFQALGSNGRSCDSCHKPENGWSVTPAALKQRFDASQGTDPIFRTHDGANRPDAKVKTLKDRLGAYSLLLSKGLIRIGLALPAQAEFQLAAVSDPYGYLTPVSTELSLYRRPLPATNLKFLNAVMWDGRETVDGKPIAFDLRNQANTATTGHAQGSPLPEAQRRAIVAFETRLFTAQVEDLQAGALTPAPLKGGPIPLSKQRFYPGINAFGGDPRTGAAFDPTVFTLFNPWNKLIDTDPTDIRAAIARGQKLFNTRGFVISGVAGLNDSPDFGSPATLVGTCSTCHNVPNVGGDSGVHYMDTGVADAANRSGDLPLYTLRNKTTGATLATTDPGRAMITGLWSDIGRFKVPGLRGLAARAPYFHNGMAPALGNVLDFYDGRFHLGLDNRERLDLILFLRSL